ncbi:putative ribonuclease H-like domain-containing protein, partial [Tanacetum coccineum]
MNTEAEYIAASHCCGQVLWIQNQMLDYGFNFMQTKIHVDNENAICVPVGFDKTKGIGARGHTKRTCTPIETSDALVVQDNALIMQDGLGCNWSYIAQDEPTEFALMAYTLGSDTELGLESIEAQLIVYQKNEAVYEEKIAVLEFEVKDKGDNITRLTNQLEQNLKEKEDLKAKLEQFKTSSKNLNKLINSQISSKDKTGLGYGDQLNENDSSGSELFNSVFDSRSSNGDDNQTNDRFKKDNGYHIVHPPLTGNYMPLLADLSFAGLDDSVYRPTANKTSASVSQVETSITPPSNTSVEMPRVESVRPSGVIIEDCVSDDDEDIFQSNDVQTTVKPRMVTQSPKVDRKDWNGKMTQKLGLGFGFTKKACFVCGSHNHLIKDYDFHEKRMPKESVLGKGTGHREVRPIWNNTQRINHQNKFVPTAVLTRSGRIPVSTAKQYVNTATPKNRVNVSKSKINTFPKSHSPIRRPFYKSTVLNTRVSKEKVNTVRVNGVNTAGQTAVSTVKGNGVTAVKASAGCVWRPKMTDLNNGSKDNSGSWISKRGNPQQALKYKGMFDSGCSRHMTGNKALLTDYQDIDGGFVAFGGSTRGGKITGIGKIRTNKIDFEDVFFVKELKFNLFSVSQMCDKKNSVLFTETECLVLSPDFKLIDESQVLLRVPRQNNMYNFDLKNVVPSGDLTCLFAKATIDESKLWHRRLGHVNFKTMNKLVKGNLVRGLPSKTFENDHTCVACQKGKQHKASCKTKHVSSISQPLQMLHMDLFGPTSVRSINHKTYCLVVTDDFSRFSWVFFLATKSETSGILKKFITEVENQLNHKVKVIRSDNGTEFKNREMDEFCGQKGIKREYSVARTPQQNGVAKRKNRTLIEAARTMLADSLLPTIFWAEAVNTACYKNVKAGHTEEENVSTQQYIVFPLWSSISSSYKSSDDKTEDDTTNNVAGKNNVQEPASEYDQALKNVLDRMMNQDKEATEQSDADVNTASASRTFSPPHDPLMLELEDTAKIQRTGTFGNAYDDDDLETNNNPYADESVGAEADFNNMEPSTIVEAMQEELLQFKIQKMDVKSVFLYGTMEEEVYVCQPPVWYETLSTYLLDNGFHKGQIDKTLFIKRLKGVILLVQVYVDDIIFGSTKKSLCDEFEQIMHNRFQMSLMGELTFFLGLQVKQKEDGIFISQD